MTEFIAGLFVGAISMFFAIGWLWTRAVEQIETDSVDFSPHSRNGQ